MLKSVKGKTLINNKLYYFLLLTFLIFPKIIVVDSDIYYQRSGILIGEFTLIICIFVYFCSFSVIRKIPSLLIVLFVFALVLIILSSLIQGLFHGVFPLQAITYFCRVSIYFLFFFILYEFTKKQKDPYIFYSIYKQSYIIHAVISILLFVYYYFKYQPSLNDQIWVQHVGYRLFSIFGLGLTLNGEDWFTVVGGGSSNLLASWSIGFIILLDNFEAKKRIKLLGFVLSFLMVALASSRGGVLTLLIYFISKWLLSSGIWFKLGTLLFVSSLVFILIITANYYEIDIPLLTRLLETYQGDGEWDGSTQGRFDNYLILLNMFFSNPVSVLFGLGFDENILYLQSGWTLVESFLGTTIFCGGIFSLTLLMVFYVLSYKNKDSNNWYKSLWQFLFFQTLVNWSITGGDFFAAPALFTMIYLISLGHFKNLKIIN